jgi:hypothetical protein
VLRLQERTTALGYGNTLKLLFTMKRLRFKEIKKLSKVRQWVIDRAKNQR